MRLKFLLSLVVALMYWNSDAQVVIFSESMGTIASPSIAQHESVNAFDNDVYTMTNGGVTTTDVRTTGASAGYSGASGGANIWFSTSTITTYGFAIEGIDASNYTNLSIQFGYRKEGASAFTDLVLEYWNGSSWINIANTPSAFYNESATATVGWYLSKNISLPAGAQISGLKLRFLKINNGTGLRIDDIKLSGIMLPCAPTANTITPTSGPVGTEILVTATQNNLAGASAKINGITANVVQVSATQIKVTVPVGATSGNIVTTNSAGCTATNPFTVISGSSTSCEGGGSVRSKIFISEVTDHGTGSHSYVELFNSTGAAVNLNNYKLNIHNNGASTATSSITLPNFVLANNSAYIIAFGGSNANDNYGGITPNLVNSSSGINNDDHIRLLDATSTWIDLWGATNGSAFTITSNDYYYRRKSSGITAPSTTWNASDWIASTPVDYSNVGIYDSALGTPPVVTVQPSSNPTCKATTLSATATEGFSGGNALTYQWYAVAPNAATWTALSNSGIYSGVTAATLGIADVNGLEGYQFYSQVRENDGNCFTPTNAVMIHEAPTSTWNGIAWSPSPPTLNTKVVIAATYNTLTQGSFEACSVVINPVQSLTISPDDYVAIQTNLTVNGNLVVDDSASLVMIDDAGTVSSAGNTQILRTTKPYKKFDYTYWSSPVAGATVGTTFPTWRTDYSFSFNTANFSDVAPLDGFDDNQNDWVTAGPSATMTAGKGYIVMAPTTGTFPTTNTVNFSGTVNNGVITVPMALSGNAANVNDDFNLIGNPYPSAISATAFINANPTISGTLYFWSHVTAVSTSSPGPDYSNYTRDDYALFNLTGGTRASLTMPASSVPTGFIASGQGFFVEAVSASNALFNNSMRSKLHDNSDFFRNTTPIERDRIWLNLRHADDLFSQALVGYFDDATLDVDWGYDGIVSRTGSTISLYSIVNDDPYKIQGRPSFSTSDLVPMGYTTSIAGSFTIEIDNTEGQLAGAQSVYIQDMQNGIIHDLKQAPYVFSTVAGTYNDRFVIRYTDGALSVDDFADESIGIVSNNGIISLRSLIENIHVVEVYDLLGRRIHASETVDSSNYDTPQLVNQVLIVKVKLSSGTVITRKVLGK